jgi:hypothetical protein
LQAKRKKYIYMKTLREVIERELSAKNKTHKWLYEQIEITEQAYFAMLRRNSTKEKSLDKLGKPLNITGKYILNQMYSDSEVNTDTVGYWKGRYEVLEVKYNESVQKISVLANTIQVLSLGKFRAVFREPANISKPFFFAGFEVQSEVQP